MTVRLARLWFSKDASVWRLQLEGATTDDPGKLIEMPWFSGDIWNPDDLERVNAALASWGVKFDAAGWRDSEGTFVVPIVQHPAL